jgi:multidrug efflux pump subunit AcrA (membrane-fusion protein)
VIRVPFACRIAEKRIEKQEYARPGDLVAVAHGVDRAEVVAQVSLDRLRHVLPASAGPVQEEIAGLSSEQIFERFGLEAVVRLEAGETAIEWPARFERFGASLDPTTRTLSVTVSVDEPYRKAIPGSRPALVHGMYCEVELKGLPRKALPVPRSAVHGDLIYVVDGDDRLELRPVEVAWVQGNLAVLEAGAEPGERVVLSDVVPAIAGTLLLPQGDEQAARHLELEAVGEAKAR